MHYIFEIYSVQFMFSFFLFSIDLGEKLRVEWWGMRIAMKDSCRGVATVVKVLFNKADAIFAKVSKCQIFRLGSRNTQYMD